MIHKENFTRNPNEKDMMISTCLFPKGVPGVNMDIHLKTGYIDMMLFWGHF
jgi:hypothetical protein